ncbi:MAG: DUF4405 domain-containing protein [Bilifractor sp.]|jgi:hypothetical protein
MKNRNRRSLRVITDFAIGVLMFFQMSSQYTGLKNHELFGILMTVAVVFHQVINYRWYRSLLKGKYNAMRIVVLVTDLALLADMAALIVCGFSMAEYYLPRHLIPIDREAAVVTHLMCGYLGFLLMGFHAHLHMGKSRGKRSGRRGEKVRQVLFAAAAAFGVYALIHEHFFLYITRSAHFVLFDDTIPAVFYELELLGVWMLGAWIAGLVKKILLPARKFKENRG